MKHNALGTSASAPTIGVEEEFVLADRRTRQATRRGADVAAAAERLIGGACVGLEMTQAQVETVSRICRNGEELAAELTRLRAGVTAAASTHHCLLVPSGTAVLGHPGPPPILDKPRYHTIHKRFGPVAWKKCASACHVHVGVDDPAEAVQVTNYLRLWSPVLIALTANSPFSEGVDTGYASWRTVLWGHWPSAGPPPYLQSLTHYEQVAQSLIATGAALDTAMVYWHVRPSRHVPTVEVRVADVMPDSADTVAFALLIRALVTMALDAVRMGEAAPAVPGAVLRAACWQAARWGLSGKLMETHHPEARVLPATQVVDRLRDHVEERLKQHADLESVGTWLDRTEHSGTGADRQRRVAVAARGRLESVVDDLALLMPDGHHD